MSTLTIIDGSGLFSRHYMAKEREFPDIYQEKDLAKKNELCQRLMKQTNGVYTEVLGDVLKKILSIQKAYNSEYFVVLFDKSSQTTFRKKQYPAYKATRTPKTEAFKQQIISLKTILDHIGVSCFWSDDFEADDLAGSLIKHFKGDVDQVYFVTADHDWLQLVGGNVIGILYQSTDERAAKLRNDYKGICPMNDPMNDWYGTERPLRRTVAFNSMVTAVDYGVYPHQVPDLKALEGDTSDNIPGVKGIGHETAVALLKCFSSVDAIYAAIDGCMDEVDAIDLEQRIKSFGVKRSPIKALINGRQNAMLSKSLATIYTDIPIGFSIERLQYQLKEDQLEVAINWYDLPECRRFLSNKTETRSL